MLPTRSERLVSRLELLLCIDLSECVLVVEGWALAFFIDREALNLPNSLLSLQRPQRLLVGA